MINELEAIKEIKNGKKLSAFDIKDITTLMKIAAICNHSEEYMQEVEAIGWDKASARVSVLKDFRNIEYLPLEFEADCAPELAAWARNISMSDANDFTRIINDCDDLTKQKIVRDNPSSRRFLLSDRNIKRAALTNKSRTKENIEKVSTAVKTNSSLDFSIIDDGSGVFTLNPMDFLLSDIEDKTIEWLKALLNTDDLFPEYFLEALLLPNKRYVTAMRKGHTKSAETYNSQKISYLDKAVCLNIAELHPEAAITCPSFLTKEGIKNFWNRKRDVLSKAQMTYYFLQFPAELLDISMAEDIVINIDVLNHAPNIFAGTEVAFKYISRNPKMIFEADKAYQREGLLVSGAITLNKENVEKIKDENLRTKIKLAYNFD